ncbi:unnamed protein product, partial [Ranitomeya imitator]
MQRPTELPLVKKDVRRDACLRKQKSMTNLSFVSKSTENGMLFSYQASWHEEATNSQIHVIQKDEKVQENTCSLSKVFSKSMQTLLPAASWEMENETSSCSLTSQRKSSYQFSGGQDLVMLSVAGCSQLVESQHNTNLGDIRKSWSEEEEDNCLREGTAYLDEEVIMTMLVDLEQALCCESLGEDPEARRMRTVKNIADLRQNLEETMSSLRGTQISHSTLETTFDSTVTTEVSGRSLPSLTSRSSTVTWRLGQGSPRLQAGDAPSFVGAYPRSNTGRFIHTDPSRFMYTTPLRRAAVSRLGNLSQVDICEKGNHDLDLSSEVDVGGYMSDGDILGKSLRSDDINSGYLTDGGLNLYTRSLNRIPDLTTSRDVIHRGVHDIAVDADRTMHCDGGLTTQV